MNLTRKQVRALANNATVKQLVDNRLKLEAIAEVTREEVDAYILPIFESFEFTNKRTGERITDPKFLYKSNDEKQVAAYFAACDVAHAEHGHDLKPGVCPVLIAKNNLLYSRNALVEFVREFFGFPEIYNCELRDKLEDLTIRFVLTRTPKA